MAYSQNARRFKRGLVVTVVLVVAACSSEPSVSADAFYFQGLDPEVVAEVLANPVAREKIDTEPEATRPSMAQAIVVNFIGCREALRVYQTWIRTGTPPEVGPLPTPTQPVEPGATANRDQRLRFVEAVASGDPEQVRFLLTAEGSCGQWIPAIPGDPAGPTIRDVVEGVG